MTRIAVLGCGPAGLLAAHAGVRAGATVDIYSHPVAPSTIGGAQYLHRSIPGITSDKPDGRIDLFKIGEPEQYAKRVYHDKYARTSWDDYAEGVHSIWSMQRAYDFLWQCYNGLIQHAEINYETMMRMLEWYEHVFVAIPAKAVCRRPEDHQFNAQKVWISSGATAFDMTIMLNGTPIGSWYRMSNIFGYKSIEWAKEPTLTDSSPIFKPLNSTCDCIQSVARLHGVGRYGTWQKGVLIHHAYERVIETLAPGRTQSAHADGGV